MGSDSLYFPSDFFLVRKCEPIYIITIAGALQRIAHSINKRIFMGAFLFLSLDFKFVAWWIIYRENVFASIDN